MKKIISVAFLVVMTITTNAQSGFKVLNTFKIDGPGGWDYIAVQPKSDNLYVSHATQINPKIRIMRANNTLFVYFNKGGGIADIAMLTADNPRQVVESIKQFGQAMKVAKFKTLKFQIDNPDIVKAIKMAGGEPKLSGVAGQQMTGIVEL